MEPAILAILSVIAGSASVVTYRFIKRRNQRLLREALRKKYAPDLPELKNHETTTIVHSETEKIDDDDQVEIPPVVRTKQIEELTEKDYNDWETRDNSRNENIVELRLIIEELLDEMPPSDEEYDDDERIMELEVREAWIEENDEDLEEHATFVEREDVGSGIIV